MRHGWYPSSTRLCGFPESGASLPTPKLVQHQRLGIRSSVVRQQAQGPRGGGPTASPPPPPSSLNIGQVVTDEQFGLGVVIFLWHKKIKDQQKISRYELGFEINADRRELRKNAFAGSGLPTTP